MKVGGNNYIQTIGNDLRTDNTIGVVAEDLNLGVDSTVKNVGSNITSVVTVSPFTTIGDYALYSCSDIESITIPDGIRTIGVEAFRSCTKISSGIDF